MPSSRHASLTALQRAPANRSGRRWTLIDEGLCMFSFPRSMSSTGEGAYPPRFKDRVVLVTGGANGIGSAIARRFVQEHATVVVADIDGDKAARLAEELTHDGPGTATSQKIDIGVEEEVSAMIDEVVARHGKLDVLVNNAARFILKSVEATTSADWDAILSTNVKGYAFATKHAIRVMKQRGGGSSSRLSGANIVNLGSISSFIAQQGLAPYSTTKGAVLQLTRCTAADIGQYGIRCNAVCPGPILTDATKSHAESQGLTVDDLVASMTGMMIQHRMGMPEEVAAAVAFMASNDASFITGAALMVDGGYSTM